MVNDTDGFRVSDCRGWWLLHASNTQPALVARCEGPDENSLKNLKEQLLSQLKISGIKIDDASDLAA